MNYKQRHRATIAFRIVLFAPKHHTEKRWIQRRREMSVRASKMWLRLQLQLDEDARTKLRSKNWVKPEMVSGQWLIVPVVRVRHRQHLFCLRSFRVPHHSEDISVVRADSRSLLFQFQQSLLLYFLYTFSTKSLIQSLFIVYHR